MREGSKDSGHSHWAGARLGKGGTRTRPQLPLHAPACILLACGRERGPGAGDTVFDSEKLQDGRGGKWGNPLPSWLLNTVSSTPDTTWHATGRLGDRARPQAPSDTWLFRAREPLSPTCNSGHNVTRPLETMARSVSAALKARLERGSPLRLLRKGSLDSGPAQEHDSRGCGKGS